MEKKVGLTASEISQIWGSYMNASLTSTVLSYFLEKVEDEDINSVLKQAYTLSQSDLEKLSHIFEQENKPIPIGFTNEDVNLDAPRLYTDNYFLQYAYQMGMLGMTSCSMALSMSTREDIYQFFSGSLRKFNELHEKAMAVSKTKGVYSSPPSIPTPDEADFVKKQSFLTG